MNRYWSLRYVPYLGDKGGDCDDPLTKNKSIRVWQGLPEKEELRALIHEITHAANWETFSEEFVDQFSSDLANILWRLGFRKTMNNEDKSD